MLPGKDKKPAKLMLALWHLWMLKQWFCQLRQMDWECQGFQPASSLHSLAHFTLRSMYTADPRGPRTVSKCEGPIFPSPGYWCDLGLDYSKGIQTNPSQVIIKMKSTSAEQLFGAFQKVCFSLWWIKSQGNLQKDKKKNKYPSFFYICCCCHN